MSEFESGRDIATPTTRDAEFKRGCMINDLRNQHKFNAGFWERYRTSMCGVGLRCWYLLVDQEHERLPLLTLEHLPDETLEELCQALDAHPTVAWKDNSVIGYRLGGLLDIAAYNATRIVLPSLLRSVD